jgi:hypothetical protein
VAAVHVAVPAVAVKTAAAVAPRASAAAAQVRVAVASPAPADANATGPPWLHDAEDTARAYLDALISGDDATAQAQLLASSGSPGSQLSEKQFLDKESRIVDLSASATSATTASVDADVQTAKGLYYVHFEVQRLDSGVVLIREHNSTKS